MLLWDRFMSMSSGWNVAGWLAGAVVAGGMMLRLEAQQPPPAATAVPAPAALVGRYCISCHNERLKRGNLALDAIVTDEVGQHADVWEKVGGKIRASQMPAVGLAASADVAYGRAG